MNNSISDIKLQALRASKWAFLANLVPALVTPLLTIILAKLLIPEDYGIVSIGGLVLALLNMLQQFGLGPALIQCEANVKESSNIVFWLSIGLGILLCGVLWVISPIIGDIYAEPRVINVLRALGFNLVLSSFVVVPSSIMQRQFQNKALFWTQSIASIAPFFISIPMAKMGMGYWALVGGTLVGSFIRSVLIWHQSHWLPELYFNVQQARKLLRFGFFVLFELILGWMLVYLDKAVIGKVLGMEDLGVYTIGFTISAMIIGLPLSAITGVTLPAFSRLQNDKEELKNAYLKGTKLVASYAIPAGIGLAIVAIPMVNLLFGDKWRGLAPVLSILALYSGFGNLWILSSDAFKAIGRPDIIPKLYIWAVIYMVPVFLFSAQYGLIVFSVSRASVVLVFAVPHVLLVTKYLGLPKTYLLNVIWGPLVSAIAMACACVSVKVMFQEMSDLVSLIVTILIGGITYLVILHMLDRDFLNLLTRTIKYTRRQTIK